MICSAIQINSTYRYITTRIVFFDCGLEEFNFGCFFLSIILKLNINDMNNIERTTLIIKLIERTEAKEFSLLTEVAVLKIYCICQNV